MFLTTLRVVSRRRKYFARQVTSRFGCEARPTPGQVREGRARQERHREKTGVVKLISRRTDRSNHPNWIRPHVIQTVKNEPSFSAWRKSCALSVSLLPSMR